MAGLLATVTKINRLPVIPSKMIAFVGMVVVRGKEELLSYPLLN